MSTPAVTPDSPTAGVEPEQLETPAPPTPQPDNPAAVGPAPPIAQVAPPSLSPDQQQELSQPTDQQQPQFELDNRPGLWHRVLVGALGGLVQGNVVGAIHGAIAGGMQTEDQAKRAALAQSQNDQLNQATMNYKIQFAHAQAAASVADAAAQDYRIQNMPQDQQTAEFARNMAALKSAEDAGLKPTLISENSEPGAKGALEGLTQTRRAIPYLAVLNIGNSHVGFALPDAANDASALPILNNYLQMTNQQPIDKSTFDALPASVQQTYLKNAITFGTETADAKDAAGLASKYRSYADSYSGSDPAIKARLNTIATSYENSRDWYAKNSADLIAAKTAAQQAAKGGETVVVPQKDGTNVVMNRDQVPAGAFNYKVDASKVNSLVGGFNDVQQKIDKLAAVDYADVQQGRAAALVSQGLSLGIGAGGAHVNVPVDRENAWQQEFNNAGATQATRDYVVAYLGAREAITQLPRLQTFGQSSRMTEQQMQAAQNQLPQPGDDASMAAQKLSAVQDILDPLRRQVPRMPGATLNPTWRDRQSSQPSSGPNYDTPQPN